MVVFVFEHSIFNLIALFVSQAHRGMLQAFHIQQARNQRSQKLLILGALLPISILTSIAPLITPLLLQLDETSETGTTPYTSSKEIFALLGVGLVGNVLANVALHIRFSENYITFATAISIAGTLLNAVVSLISIGLTVHKHQSTPGLLFSGEFIVLCIVSFLDCLIASLLIWDWCRTQNFELEGKGITNRHQTLVYSVTVTSSWAFVGGLVFSLMQKWSYLSALFFSLVTITTIGFGNQVPQTTLTRVLVMIYAFVGIVCIGFMFAVVRLTVKESVQAKCTLKVAQYREQRRREHEIENAQHRPLSLSISELARTLALQPFENWDDVRKKQIHEEQDEIGRLRRYALINALVFWIIGSTIFYFTEQQWSYFESLYFCFIAFRTIGYGDFVPTSPFGQAIFVFYVFFGVGTVTYLVSVVTEDFSKRLKHHVINVERKRKIDETISSGPCAAEDSDHRQLTSEQVKEIVKVAKKLERNMQRIIKRGNNQMNNGAIRRRASFSVNEDGSSSSGVRTSGPKPEWALMSSYHEKFNRIIAVVQNHLINEGFAAT
ncbi:voltage-gated potassium channel [Basidiobolus meristosporus CBS 931.73]|uniref:Voltage-gated potassium channel n=1 Tax=Basidiobolus meristosporus CBS 931.73 TaxID=1314790 RepID=A0A1Y1Y3L6_9FUNG|nr:voltage-gated potassium channel [Basidiobolus meristosporus CBS 931.73]|eukprot:ORX92475.1 voltage-gated potassium channel [Basidiobolus meristosporus CBS 931.73]